MALKRTILRHITTSKFLIFLLLKATLISSSNSLTKIVERDQRLDPLNGFKQYEGGYDITNKHYYASTAFKGVYLFAMAGLWMVGVFIVLIFCLIFKKRIRSFTYLKSQHCGVAMIMVIVGFTLLMIFSSGFTLVSCHMFRYRANKLIKTLLGAGGATCHAIRRVMNVMDEMHQVLCPYSESICERVSSSRMNLKMKLMGIRAFMHTATRLFDAALQLIYYITLGTVFLCLAIVTAATVLLLLHWHPGLIIVIWFCWILTTVCWFLAGFHFFLHIYMDDTCLAIKEFENNPSNNSLTSILPCPNTATADAILTEVGFGITALIAQLNLNITRLVELEDGGSSAFENMTVCNPYFNPPWYNHDPNRCLNKHSVSDMLNLLQEKEKSLPKASVKMIRNYGYMIRGLTNVYSDLRKLVRCSYLKIGFNDALERQCKPLKSSVKMLLFSMISLSVCLMVLEISWFVKMLEKKEVNVLVKSTIAERVEV